MPFPSLAECSCENVVVDKKSGAGSLHLVIQQLIELEIYSII